MITKEQYLGLLKNEFRIIKHLSEKVTVEQLSHKPTEPQRTLQELMAYLTAIFAAGADGIATGDGEAYKKYFGKEMPTLENFTTLMEQEEKEVMGFFEKLSDEDLDSEITMWGRTQSRTLHMMGLLSMAAAYKMQMFLYMKQSGTSNIGTSNLWAGMDQPPKVA